MGGRSSVTKGSNQQGASNRRHIYASPGSLYPTHPPSARQQRPSSCKHRPATLQPELTSSALVLSFVVAVQRQHDQVCQHVVHGCVDLWGEA